MKTIELTELEKTVLKLTGQGNSGEEIQAELAISHAKLFKTKKECIIKFNARNCTHAIILALREKLI
ncbi:MAG: LuxR C-terminal-related transcriptional regulator [Heliobacteriaceae bacterium]|jgi:DNA-binding CsgD family transcriptional regulator|nr:LuxR C-terminal-related transcriptional regulator [Heliobacteriaceae bacterium]